MMGNLEPGLVILPHGIPPHRLSAGPPLLASFDEHFKHVWSVVLQDKLVEFRPSRGWDSSYSSFTGSCGTYRLSINE